MKWRTFANIAAWAALTLVLALTLGAAPFRLALAQQAAQAAPDPLVLIRSFACVVPGYGKVAIVNDPKLDNLALAERIEGTNELVIYVRTDLMNLFKPTTRVFWLEHECSHHRLGHTKSTRAVSDACVAKQEDAADCSAIQTMVNATPPMIDAGGLAVIENDLTRIPHGPGGIYKTGAQRAQQVDRCARDDAWAQGVIAAGNCAPP